jgi:hypothetical protein
MQWRCKHAFQTIERLCFLRGQCKVVIKRSSAEKNFVEFRDPAYWAMSLGAEELN